LNRLDRQMNAHLFLFGPTGSGKSATLNNILNQVTAIYRPRLFIVEAGNSFGCSATSPRAWACRCIASSSRPAPG
jgi:Cdc6-like AAA superfamily ATPase